MSIDFNLDMRCTTPSLLAVSPQIRGEEHLNHKSSLEPGTQRNVLLASNLYSRPSETE